MLLLQALFISCFSTSLWIDAGLTVPVIFRIRIGIWQRLERRPKPVKLP